MASVNSVPESVSYPIPGFAEAQSAWNDRWRKWDARNREIAADRAAWWRGRNAELGMGAQSRLMDGINPLKVAADYTTGELATRGLFAGAKATFLNTRMRPGYVRAPESFGGAFTPAGPGKTATVRAYETAAETLRNIYKNPDARRILRTALETGDRSNPLVKLYDNSRTTLSKLRGKLDSQAARMDSEKFKSELREALAGVKTDAEVGRDLAKSLRVTPQKGPGVLSRAGSLWTNFLVPYAKAHPYKTGAWTVAASGPAVLAPAVVMSKSRRDGKQDDTTEEVKNEKQRFDEAYSRFTGDAALANEMSDTKALQAALRAARDTAVAEIAWDRGRVSEVRRRMGEFLGSVTNSPTFTALLAENETRYAARALSPDNYQREFRETYRDPASQAVEDDFWGEIGGAP